jgi:hypothetical protein
MKEYKIAKAAMYVDKKGARWVVYISLIEGAVFSSVHKCEGLSDIQAMGEVKDKKVGYEHGAFRREHFRQVQIELEKKHRKEKPLTLN